MNEILRKATEIESEIIQDRRNLHKYPEVGFDLPKTQAYIMERLKKMGIDAHPCGKISQEKIDLFKKVGVEAVEKVTGIVATIGKGNPCILLRADMDALPMQETTGLPFASEVNGTMHACGHDSHMSMLLGAAKILKEKEGSLQGSVKLMFQTGEELGCGSKMMIDDGVLENPKVDVAMAMHILPDIESGKVHYINGVVTSSMDTWIIKIQGKGGHSSMPQHTVDPVMIMTQLYTQLNLIVNRESPPDSVVAMTIGSARSGTVSNIIPDTAELQMGLRTYDPEVRDHLEKRFNEMIDLFIKAWRGTYTFEKLHTPSTVSDKNLVSQMIPFIEEVAGQTQVSERGPMPFSEDFGYVTSLVPGMFLILGAGSPESYPLHNPNMILDEKQLKLGAAIYANCAMGFLNRLNK